MTRQIVTSREQWEMAQPFLRQAADDGDIYDEWEQQLLPQQTPEIDYSTASIFDVIKQGGDLLKWVKANPEEIKVLAKEVAKGDTSFKDAVGNSNWDLLQDGLEIVAIDGDHDAYQALDSHRQEETQNEWFAAGNVPGWFEQGALDQDDVEQILKGSPEYQDKAKDLAFQTWYGQTKGLTEDQALKEWAKMGPLAMVAWSPGGYYYEKFHDQDAWDAIKGQIEDAGYDLSDEDPDYLSFEPTAFEEWKANIPDSVAKDWAMNPDGGAVQDFENSQFHGDYSPPTSSDDVSDGDMDEVWKTLKEHIQEHYSTMPSGHAQEPFLDWKKNIPDSVAKDWASDKDSLDGALEDYDNFLYKTTYAPPPLGVEDIPGLSKPPKGSPKEDTTLGQDLATWNSDFQADIWDGIAPFSAQQTLQHYIDKMYKDDPKLQAIYDKHFGEGASQKQESWEVQWNSFLDAHDGWVLDLPKIKEWFGALNTAQKNYYTEMPAVTALQDAEAEVGDLDAEPESHPYTGYDDKPYVNPAEIEPADLGYGDEAYEEAVSLLPSDDPFDGKQFAKEMGKIFQISPETIKSYIDGKPVKYKDMTADQAKVALDEIKSTYPEKSELQDIDDKYFGSEKEFKDPLLDLLDETDDEVGPYAAWKKEMQSNGASDLPPDKWLQDHFGSDEDIQHLKDYPNGELAKALHEQWQEDAYGNKANYEQSLSDIADIETLLGPGSQQPVQDQFPPGFTNWVQKGYPETFDQLKAGKLPFDKLESFLSAYDKFGDKFKSKYIDEGNVSPNTPPQELIDKLIKATGLSTSAGWDDDAWKSNWDAIAADESLYKNAEPGTESALWWDLYQSVKGKGKQSEPEQKFTPEFRQWLKDKGLTLGPNWTSPGFQPWMKEKYNLSPAQVADIMTQSGPGGKYEDFGGIQEYLDEWQKTTQQQQSSSPGIPTKEQQETLAKNLMGDAPGLIDDALKNWESWDAEQWKSTLEGAANGKYGPHWQALSEEVASSPQQQQDWEPDSWIPSEYMQDYYAKKMAESTGLSPEGIKKVWSGYTGDEAEEWWKKQYKATEDDTSGPFGEIKEVYKQIFQDMKDGLEPSSEPQSWVPNHQQLEELMQGIGINPKTDSAQNALEVWGSWSSEDWKESFDTAMAGSSPHPAWEKLFNEISAGATPQPSKPFSYKPTKEQLEESGYSGSLNNSEEEWKDELEGWKNWDGSEEAPASELLKLKMQEQVDAGLPPSLKPNTDWADNFVKGLGATTPSTPSKKTTPSVVPNKKKKHNPTIQNMKYKVLDDQETFSQDDLHTLSSPEFQEWFQQAPVNYQQVVMNSPAIALGDFQAGGDYGWVPTDPEGGKAHQYKTDYTPTSPGPGKVDYGGGNVIDLPGGDWGKHYPGMTKNPQAPSSHGRPEDDPELAPSGGQLEIPLGGGSSWEPQYQPRTLHRGINLDLDYYTKRHPSLVNMPHNPSPQQVADVKRHREQAARLEKIREMWTGAAADPEVFEGAPDPEGYITRGVPGKPYTTDDWFEFNQWAAKNNVPPEQIYDLAKQWGASRPESFGTPSLKDFGDLVRGKTPKYKPIVNPDTGEVYPEPAKPKPWQTPAFANAVLEYMENSDFKPSEFKGNPGLGGMGPHWSTSENVSKGSFTSGPTDHGFPVVISTLWNEQGEDPNSYDGAHGFDSEKEITLGPGAPHIPQRMQIKHYDDSPYDWQAIDLAEQNQTHHASVVRPRSRSILSYREQRELPGMPPLVQGESEFMRKNFGPNYHPGHSQEDDDAANAWVMWAGQPESDNIENLVQGLLESVHDAGLGRYTNPTDASVALQDHLRTPKHANLPGWTPTGETRGTHGSQVYQGPEGNEWLVKTPPEDFLLQLQKATMALQDRAGLQTPPHRDFPGQGGKPGFAQQMFPGARGLFNGRPRLDKMNPQDLLEVQKHNVFDWLMSNHDAHPGQWLRLNDGTVAGIDKDQAFKHFGSDRLDPDFHPNQYYNERPPVYNNLWSDFAQGRGQMLDPSTGELGDFIQNLQGIPDDEFQETLRPYAEGAAQAGKLALPGFQPGLGSPTIPSNDPQAFLSAVTQRKNNLGQDFSDYYQRSRPVQQQERISMPIRSRSRSILSHREMREG